MQQQNLKIREGSVFEALSNIELVSEHWKELIDDEFKSLLKINFNLNDYLNLEVNNQLITLLLEYDNVLVGYSVNILSPHPHHCDVLISQNDLLFLHKDFRKSFIGLKLIKETEKIVKDRGAKMMTWGAKPSSSFDKLLKMLDNKPIENLYIKEL